MSRARLSPLLLLLACREVRREDCTRFAELVNAASPGIAAASADVAAVHEDPALAFTRLRPLAERFGALAQDVTRLELRDETLVDRVGQYRLLATRLHDVAGAAAHSAERGDAGGALKLLQDLAELAAEQDQLVQSINAYCGAR